MDFDACPLINCCIEYKTNQNVFEYIEIADEVNDITRLINRAELESVNVDSQYRFYFFLEAYKQSYWRFPIGSSNSFKYRLRFILYELQTVTSDCLILFVHLTNVPKANDLKIYSAYAFYYLIFLSFDDAVISLQSFKEVSSNKVLNHLKSRSFKNIFDLIGDFWYIPAIRNPATSAVTKLLEIDKLSKGLTAIEFNTRVMEILGLKIPSIDIAPNIAAQTNIQEPAYNLEQVTKPTRKNRREPDNNKAQTNIQEPAYNLEQVTKPARKNRREPDNNKAETNIPAESYLSPERTKQSPMANYGLVTPVNQMIPSLKQITPLSEMLRRKPAPTKVERVRKCSVDYLRPTYVPAPPEWAHQWADDFTNELANEWAEDLKYHTKISPLSFSDSSLSDSPTKDPLNTAFIIHTPSVSKKRSRSDVVICSPAIQKRQTSRPINLIASDISIDYNGDPDNDRLVNELKACFDLTFSKSTDLPQFGSYTCTALLGSGSFSKVYAASTADNKSVAIKVIRFDQRQLKETTMNEIEILRKMSITGLSIGLIDGHVSPKGAIIIMEKGLTDMKMFITDNFQLMDRFFILHYWGSMMKCVRAMHDLKIAHLDLKLHNFVVCESLKVKLIDYGISQMYPRDKIMHIDDSMGTVVYMSPELLLNERKIYPYKCDIWSMGMMLYTMVFNDLPVPVDNITEYAALMDATGYKFQFPECDRNCPILTKIMFLCLQRDPTRRLEAEEILDVMNNLLN